jgi:hypothetical protein
VGLAWPLMVWLTPSADRPWISGTSDNSIWSLIFGYNGLGRLTGQQGAPGGGGFGGGGGGGGPFGGSTGALRLLNEALGGQAGWLLGFALVAGVGLVVLTRLRRDDARTGWLIAVGGAWLTIAVAFSKATGIFHPYYVSELAPFTAALVGGGIATIMRGDLPARVIGPAAIVGGIVTELIVLGKNPGQLGWVPAVLIVLGGMAAVAIAMGPSLTREARWVAVATAMGVLLLAPGAWAFETLGHATSGTFPAGGPASASFGGGGGGPGGRGFAGPVFLRGAGPGLACVVAHFERLSPAPEIYGALAAHVRAGGEIVPVPFPEHGVEALARLVAWKAELLASAEPVAPLYRLHVLEAATLEVTSHRPLYDPECAACR